MIRRLSALAAGLLLIGSAGADAAENGGCGTFKWSVAREMKALATDLPVLATGAAYPQPGTGVSVTLSPQEGVAYTAKPRRAPKSAPAYGAELVGSVPQAGSYQITLSEDAWVDLVQGGKILRSTAFSGTTGCPGLRKSVRFDLMAGPVAIAISDAAVPGVKLDLLPAE